MAARTYSGQVLRQRAASHYSGHVPVRGVDPQHLEPDPAPDPFTPDTDVAASVPGDVWAPTDASPHTPMPQRPITHTAQRLPPVPPNTSPDRAAADETARMIRNHLLADYRPDAYPKHRHADQGRSIEFISGRAPWQAGEAVPEESAYLQAGTNAYDSTNAPNEVYSADAGRYRLGTWIDDHGIYEFWQKQGQDPEVRAYSGLTPQLPVAKPRIEDAAPYTVPHSGATATWILDAFQRPSDFALPSETSLTDYQLVDGSVGSDFEERDRL